MPHDDVVFSCFVVAMLHAMPRITVEPGRDASRSIGTIGYQKKWSPQRLDLSFAALL